MDKRTADIAASVLGFVGILLMMAMAMSIFPWRSEITIFTGIMCFVAAGFVKKIAKTERK